MNKQDNPNKNWEEEFEKSGMTIEEWNKSILDKRDEAIEEQVKLARAERMAIEEKTQFITDYINIQGDLEVQRIMDDVKKEAEQYKNDLLTGKQVEKSKSSIMDESYLEDLNLKSSQWSENAKVFTDRLLQEAEQKYQEFINQREKQRQTDQIVRQQQLMYKDEQRHSIK